MLSGHVKSDRSPRKNNLELLRLIHAGEASKAMATQFYNDYVLNHPGDDYEWRMAEALARKRLAGNPTTEKETDLATVAAETAALPPPPPPEWTDRDYENPSPPSSVSASKKKKKKKKNKIKNKTGVLPTVVTTCIPHPSPTKKAAIAPKAPVSFAEATYDGGWITCPTAKNKLPPTATIVTCIPYPTKKGVAPQAPIPFSEAATKNTLPCSPPSSSPSLAPASSSIISSPSFSTSVLAKTSVWGGRKNTVPTATAATGSAEVQATHEQLPSVLLASSSASVDNSPDEEKNNHPPPSSPPSLSTDDDNSELFPSTSTLTVINKPPSTASFDTPLSSASSPALFATTNANDGSNKPSTLSTVNATGENSKPSPPSTPVTTINAVRNDNNKPSPPLSPPPAATIKAINTVVGDDNNKPPFLPISLNNNENNENNENNNNENNENNNENKNTILPDFSPLVDATGNPVSTSSDTNISNRARRLKDYRVRMERFRLRVAEPPPQAQTPKQPHSRSQMYYGPVTGYREPTLEERLFFEFGQNPTNEQAFLMTDIEQRQVNLEKAHQKQHHNIQMADSIKQRQHHQINRHREQINRQQQQIDQQQQQINQQQQQINQQQQQINRQKQEHVYLTDSLKRKNEHQIIHQQQQIDQRQFPQNLANPVRERIITYAASLRTTQETVELVDRLFQRDLSMGDVHTLAYKYTGWRESGGNPSKHR
jgi:hypothetical protein